MIVHDTMPSPVGALRLVASDAGLMSVEFEAAGGGHGAAGADWRPAHELAGGRAARILAETRLQLHGYFADERERFTLPLLPSGTVFQQRVWSQLREIRHGEAISYAELARRMAAPTAVRAVGGANARNPIAVIVPCHRVIGADGSLTGFGGGIERKRWLLQHEGALPA